MDYESRKIKWYWMMVFLLYCLGVVHLLFQGNPFLYSHKELRSSMAANSISVSQTVPKEPKFVATSPETAPLRYANSANGVDPLGQPRSRSYVEFQRNPVKTLVDWGDVQNVVADQQGFYLSGKSPWTAMVNLDGAVAWQFRFRDIEKASQVFPALVDQNTVFFVREAGEVVALDKRDGALRWTTHIDTDLVATPFLWEQRLGLPTKLGNKLIVFWVERATGQILPERPTLDLKPGFRLFTDPDLGRMIAVADNKVWAINPETWTTDWVQTLTEPSLGIASIVGTQIYVPTEAGKIIKIDGSKKGKIEWETELEKPALTAPTHLPIVQRIGFLDSTQHLVMLDEKTGKILWRTATDNRSPLKDTWAARLKGSNIEEFKMDWAHKGWTIWTSCSERRVCLYTPNKGQLIERLTFSLGVPVSLPISLDKRWVFFTKIKGGYEVVHFVEEAEVKRLRLEKQIKNP